MSEMDKYPRLKELESARAGLEFAAAGRKLLTSLAMEQNGEAMAMHYIKLSTAPSDAWEARVVDEWNKENKLALAWLQENGKSDSNELEVKD